MRERRWDPGTLTAIATTLVTACGLTASPTFAALAVGDAPRGALVQTAGAAGPVGSPGTADIEACSEHARPRAASPATQAPRHRPTRAR